MTESAKKRQLEKKQRVIETPADVPDNLKQSAIEFLYRIGKDVKEIIEFTGIRSPTVYACIKRFKETGTSAPTIKSGRPVTVLTAQNILESSEDRLQKSGKITKLKSQRRLAWARLRCPDLSAKKLKSRSYRISRGPMLTDTHKQSRLEKAQRMLEFVNTNSDRINRVLFTDEKIFKIGRYFNRQNHRQILSRITRNRRWKTIGRTAFPKSVMVWAGVSGMGKTKLAFLDRGIRINSAIYQNKILKKRAKPDSQKIFGHKNVVVSARLGAPAQWIQSNSCLLQQTFQWPILGQDNVAK